MSVFKEFKEFAMKGNVVDLAVGVMIGAAFGKIVDSAVKDIVMPWPALLGGNDFSNLFTVLKPGKDGTSVFKSLKEATEAGAVTLNWGVFLTAVVNFLIITFFLFLIVKAVNKMKKPEPEADAPPSDEVVLLTEIRDLLKK